MTAGGGVAREVWVKARRLGTSESLWNHAQWIGKGSPVGQGTLGVKTSLPAAGSGRR